MPAGSNPNSIAALKPHQYKPGKDWTGCKRGTKSIGASLRQWIGVLAAEDESGKARYSQADLMAIANAEDDDKSVSPMKRCAAQRLVSMCSGDRDALANLTVLLDRTEGRPNVSVSHDLGTFQRKRIIVEGVDTSAAIIPALLDVGHVISDESITDESAE